MQIRMGDQRLAKLMLTYCFASTIAFRSSRRSRKCRFRYDERIEQTSGGRKPMDATGTIVRGAIVLDQPCAFAEGTRVVVRIEPARAPAEILASIAALPLNEGRPFSRRDHDRILYGAKESS